MRCSNCGKRISDTVVATLTECPNCKQVLGPGDEAAAPALSRPPVIRNGAEPDASCPASEKNSSLDLTLPYVRAKSATGEDSSAAEKNRVTETGAHRRATGAYTVPFEQDDVPAAGSAPSQKEAPEQTETSGAPPGSQSGTGGAGRKSPGKRDTSDTLIPRDQAKTPAVGGASPAPTGRAATGLPERLGHFEIRGKLGEGGMGTVLDGHDPQLDRRVAIKVLSPKLAQDQQFVQRFLSEARAVARVAHVNVAGIYFADTDGDRNFFAMEFIEGQSLDDLIDKGGPITAKAAVGYVIQGVRGLAAAHERGIIHRDIKPANLMLRKDGVIKVTDFGLAKLTEENVSRTQTGSVMGSPHFMAPEQGRGETTDVRADVYSLGATLYFLLTGRTPYDGDSAVAVILKHQEAPVPQIDRAPPSVNRLFVRMMAKDPKDRYQSYANLMTDLIRLDRSGLLRDDVTLEQAAAASRSDRGAGPVAATPAGAGVARGAAPPARGATGLQTEKTDEEAVLLSQLDAVMKKSPTGTAGAASSMGRAAAGRLRSAAVSVTRKMLRPSEAVGEEGAGGEPGSEESRALPVGLIALGAGVAVVLLFVIALKPWRWAGSEEEGSAGGERREALEAIASLRPALEDSEPAVRRDAVMALGRHAGPTSEQLLLSTLTDPEPMVRAEAARVLGQVGRKEVRGYLIRLLSDDSPDVRQAVAEALGQLTGYARLTRIDWRESPEGLRRAIQEEFEVWLKGH